MRLPGLAALICGTLLLCGCGATLGTTGRASELPARELITEGELVAGNFRDMFEAVHSLRSTWLRQRGVQSFLRPGQIWVYLDQNRLGGIETLRLIEPTTVRWARFLSGPDATTRWGVDHNHGAILVSTTGIDP